MCVGRKKTFILRSCHHQSTRQLSPSQPIAVLETQGFVGSVLSCGSDRPSCPGSTVAGAVSPGATVFLLDPASSRFDRELYVVFNSKTT